MIIEEKIFCLSWLCCFVAWFSCCSRKIRGGGCWCCYNLNTDNMSIKAIKDINMMWNEILFFVFVWVSMKINKWTNIQVRNWKTMRKKTYKMIIKIGNFWNNDNNNYYLRWWWFCCGDFEWREISEIMKSWNVIRHNFSQLIRYIYEYERKRTLSYFVISLML